MIVHQSDLQSMNRCGEQHRRQINGEQGKQLSATAYGSVMHHALHTLERTRDLELAINTFAHYWHPLNIDVICEPVQEWIGRQSYGALATKGVETLRRYWDLKMYDDEEVLALEIPFVIPIGNTGHHLAGTIDRLAVRRYLRREFLCVDDWKTGKKKAFLKHNVQHIAYSYATTRPEFWLGDPAFLTEGFGQERGTELMERFASIPRRGWWIDLSGHTPKWEDCGEKGDLQFQRFFRAVENYAAMRDNNIFPLAIEGEVCQYCPFVNDCPEGINS